MKRLTYQTVESLLDFALETYDKDLDKGRTVVFVSHFDVAKEIVKQLITEYDYDIEYVNICNPEIDDYDKEYSIQIDDSTIFCDRAYSDELDTYYNLYGHESVFLTDDCNSAILKRIGKDADTYEVAMLDDEEDEFVDSCEHCGDGCNCCECHNESAVSTDDDKPSVKVTVNGKEVKNKELATLIGEQFLDKLTEHENALDFINEMQHWAELLMF